MRRLTRSRMMPVRARVKKLLDNSVVCRRAPELTTTFELPIAACIVTANGTDVMRRRLTRSRMSSDNVLPITTLHEVRARVKKLLDNSVVCRRAPELTTTFAPHSLALNNISRGPEVIIQNAFSGGKCMLKTGQINCFKTGHL